MFCEIQIKQQKGNMKKHLLSQMLLLVVALLSSCSQGGSSASAPVPNVQQKGCVKESDLMKPDPTSGIVGGDKVHNSQPDSKKVIMLYTESNSGNNASICTATAIAPNILITAAHCLSDKHFAIFNSSISCESGFSIDKHMFAASDAFKHPDYNQYSSEGPSTDVAIVILEKDIPSSYRIMKIADPEKVNLSKGSIQLIGYGATNFNAGGSAILRKTDLPSKQFTINKEKNIVDIDQSYGHGVCSGDSGGPSLAKINGQDYILGINSIVYGSSFNNREDACKFYARQSLAYGHLSWIKEELAKRGINISL